MPEFVTEESAEALLASLETGAVDAIITSPPYSGLPGRDDTIHVLNPVLLEAPRVLRDGGRLVVIVGATDERPRLPFEVMEDTLRRHHGRLALDSWYVWERPQALARKVGEVSVITDFILVFTQPEALRLQPLHPSSLIKTGQFGFNYGAGVTTPPDLAAYLVSRATEEDDLVVDPFVGLGEIGVQAVAQDRRFIGGDLCGEYAKIASDRIGNAKATLSALR